MKAKPNMSRLRKLSKAILSVIALAASLMIFCQIGRAQEASQEGGSGKEDIATLKRDVNTLQEELQQIINQLNELRGSRTESASNPLQLPAALPKELDVRGQPSRGEGTARVALIEYSDFECPYCGLYEREASPQIFEEYVKSGKVRLFFGDLPLPMHPRAIAAARAARCSGDQGKYWEMHDSLFAKQNALSDAALLDRAKTLGLNAEKFKDCFSSERHTEDIQKSVSEAQQMGINGTPTFFIGTIEPNGNEVTIKTRIAGARSYEVFKSMLDEVLASEGHQPAKAD